MIYGYINIYYKYGKEDNLQIALQKCEQIYNHSCSEWKGYPTFDNLFAYSHTDCAHFNLVG